MGTKRFILCFLTISILLCACGAKSTSAKETDRTDVFTITEGSQMYSGGLDEIPIGVDGESILSQCANSDCIAFYSFRPDTHSDSPEEFQTITQCVTWIDRTTFEQNTFEFSLSDIAGNAELMCMDFFDETTLYFLVHTVEVHGEAGTQSAYSIVSFDLENNTFSDLIPLDISSEPDNFGESIFCWNQTSLYVGFSNGEIYCYDLSKHNLSLYQSNLLSPRFLRNKDNHVYIVGLEEDKMVARYFSTSDNTFGEKIPIMDSGWIQFADGCHGFDFFSSGDNKIYGIDMEHQTMTELFDGFKSGVNLNHVAFFSVGQSLILCDNVTEDFLVDDYVLYSGTLHDAAVEEREELCLATLGISTDLQEAITQFNRTNTEFFISVEDYEEYGDNGGTRMRMDMMSGKLPDIINLAGLQSTSINCSEYLTDLSPYLKQTFGEDLSDIQTTVIEALMEDGQLFSITPNFNLSVLCSLDRLQEEKLTTDKFCELIETSKSKDLVSNMTVLRVLLENSLDDVIHLETKTVDTDQLQKFLEFAAAFPSTANGDNTTVQESLLNGDIVFAQAELSSLRDFRFMLTELGENIQIYGYPSPSGDSVVLEASNYLAISKSSKNPEAAWLFISSMMEPELQQQFSHRVFPIRKSCLEEQIEEAKQSEAGFSDTAEALLEQMFDRIGRQSVLDESAVQIIYEVAEAFFAGDTSLDSTIDVIDSRLSIYLSEQD